MANMALSAANRPTTRAGSGKNGEHWIVLYRGWFIALAILLVAVFVGYAISVQRGHTLASSATEKVYEYIEGSLARYDQKKLPADKLVGEFKKLLAAIDYHPVAVSALLQTGDALSGGKKHQEALEILKIADERFVGHTPHMSYFILSRLAVVYEELAQKEKAVAVLKRLSNGRVKFMEDKVHLDLGRLYYEIGDKEKSRISLNYVVGNSKEDDFVDLARIYLGKLDGK